MDTPSIRLRRFRDVIRDALWETELATKKETKEDHYQIIRMHYSQLLNSLTSVGDIVAKLFQTGNLTDLELESIQSLAPIRASAELLNIIMKKSWNVYESFLIALKNANQQDAYRLLTTSSQGQDQFTSEHHRLVRKHYDWLTKNIACDTGLTSRLFENGVLTIREHEYIGSKTDRFRKNETFLFIICRKSSEDFDKFRKALTETGQKSVAEKLKISPKNDDAQPNESDEHRFRIQRNFCWLAETIDPQSGLIELLYQKEVITLRERETITAETNAVKRNESLLNIISHKSTTDFEHFKNSLTETKQDHVARRLMEDRPKMTVGSSERKNTRKVIDKQLASQHQRKSDVPINPGKQQDGDKPIQQSTVSDNYRPGKQKTPNPCVPPKPGKQQDVDKSRHSAKGFTKDRQPLKSRSISFLKQNFEKLESYLRFEISLKLTALHQRKIGTSHNMLQGSLQAILTESLTMKKKQETGNSISRMLELEKEKLRELSSELQSVKQSLAKEERQRRESELQNKKTTEMYEHLKKQFEKQGLKPKTDGELSTDRKEEIEDYKRRLESRNQEFKEIKRKYNEIKKESQDQKVVVEQQNERIARLCQGTEQNDSRMKDEEEKFTKLETENGHLSETCRNLEAKLKDIELRFYSAENDITTPSLSHEIKVEDTSLGKEAIAALEILENELFLFYYPEGEIEIYDTKSYQILRKLQIPNMSRQWDMTADKIGKCLFILGFESDEDVHSVIVKLDVHGELLDPWPKPSGGKCGQLSTYETNLIVCLWEANIINEFSRNGDLIRTVKLSSAAGIIHPLYAIKVASMLYIVSHGRGNDDRVGICVVDHKGRIKKEGTKFGQRRRQINRLFKNDKEHRRRCILSNGIAHFTEDKKRSLLVSDLGNNNISLWSSTLEYKKTLIQFSDEELPEIVSFDESRKRLFVATNIFDANGMFMSSRVLIYNV